MSKKLSLGVDSSIAFGFFGSLISGALILGNVLNVGLLSGVNGIIFDNLSTAAAFTGLGLLFVATVLLIIRICIATYLEHVNKENALKKDDTFNLLETNNTLQKVTNPNEPPNVLVDLNPQIVNSDLASQISETKDLAVPPAHSFFPDSNDTLRKVTLMGGPSWILNFLSDAELNLCKQVSKSWREAADKIPRLIGNQYYQGVVQHEDRPVYVRMELLTEENIPRWLAFQTATLNLSAPVLDMVENITRVFNEGIGQRTGLTENEYQTLQREIGLLSPASHRKLFASLRGVYSGAIEFKPHVESLDQNYKKKYVIYATDNPEFALPEEEGSNTLTYQQYKRRYQHILIAVTSIHSIGQDAESFENRGIFRPYPQMLEKIPYHGLSMVLHGFSGIVANRFFPAICHMRVRPIQSMQRIIKDTLQPGEGTTWQRRSKISPEVLQAKRYRTDSRGDSFFKTTDLCIDIKDHIVPRNSRDEDDFIIKNSALIRIYSIFTMPRTARKKAADKTHSIASVATTEL